MLRKQKYQWTKYGWNDACCESTENSIRVRKCRKAPTNKNVDDDNCYNSDANFKWITKRKCIFQRKKKNVIANGYYMYVYVTTDVCGVCNETHRNESRFQTFQFNIYTIWYIKHTFSAFAFFLCYLFFNFIRFTYNLHNNSGN